ncbi:MAG: hypothetical protein LQ345_004282 [Seirophora villosa]|nr:MAG: hypothetical protein LQ345_004282 [Seirophora villosa]
MLLRADLHRAFDNRRFTFLPKKECTLVTHVFESESLRVIYHNVALNTSYNAPEYLFARFAWTILPLVKQFLRRRRNRLLLVQGRPQWANPDQCYADPPKDKSESASPRKGSSRRCSPTKSRSPSKRSWEEMETEAFAQDHELDPRAADQDSLSMPTKRQRQPNIILSCAIPAPALPYPQYQPSALPDGSRVPWPPEARSLALAPRHSPPWFSAAPDGASASVTTPQKISSHSNLSDPFCSLTYQDDEQQWMTCRDLRAMTTLRLLKERERSDPRGHWEKEEAWLEGILSSGGALDSSEIKRWQYVNGEEVDYPGVGNDGR